MENPKSIVLLSSKVMISEESKLNPVFLSVRFLLASNAGNLNREGQTKRFIDDLVSRQDAFECLPMYVDMSRLLAGDYDNLTHLYNRATKKFSTQQFGSLTNFYEETDEDGVTSLYAEARFPKRELDACMRLVELYEMGRLCVSIELRYNPEHAFRKDGVLFVDAHEDNALTGLCIVSQPAEVRAVALDMVAEKNADDSPDIITAGEEPVNRGETDLEKEKVELNAEVTQEINEETVEETVIAEGVAPVEEEQTSVTIAEGEGASESDAGSSEGDSGSEAGASGSDSGSGASGSDSGSGEEEEEEDPALTVDPSEEQKRINSENANAEVVDQSIETREEYFKCPDTGETVHSVTVVERYVETIDEQERTIAELKTRIAELEEIKAKYDEIVAEREAKELEAKQNQARAFAEKQGLDVNDVAVAEAVKALDYTKIAELTMAQVQEEEPETKEEPVQRIALASFVELDVGENKSYGGLLNRRNK